VLVDVVGVCMDVDEPGGEGQAGEIDDRR